MRREVRNAIYAKAKEDAAMPMREKMARAIINRRFNGDAAHQRILPLPPLAMPLAVFDEYLADVDTALDALMEPTDGMWKAVTESDTTLDAWQAMLSAAKEGK